MVKICRTRSRNLRHFDLCRVVEIVTFVGIFEVQKIGQYRQIENDNNRERVEDELSMYKNRTGITKL